MSTYVVRSVQATKSADFLTVFDGALRTWFSNPPPLLYPFPQHRLRVQRTHDMECGMKPSNQIKFDVGSESRKRRRGLSKKKNS